MIRSNHTFCAEYHDGTLRINLEGEIDHHSAATVRKSIDDRIVAERPERVLLELSAVDFMDSSGLGLIMGRFALVKQYCGTLAVLDPSPAVIKIMKLAGMERMVSVLRTKSKIEG